MKLRTQVLKLHRYLGLMVEMLLISIGLTGSLLVFQKGRKKRERLV